MIRGCVSCTNPRATRRKCGHKLCDVCVETHTHPELLAADRQRWLAENSPELSLTTAVVSGLNALRGVTVWQAKKRGGVRAGQVAVGVPDVIGFAWPDGTFIAVETKRNHKAECGCASCMAQADFGVRLTAAGGVFVPDVRSVREAVDQVRMGLARRRAAQEAAVAG